ncbi:hypothetical protein DFQ28_008377 [Apophysomyces sp. BC1034]|nr:hypothetical protein DFQ29_003447 [Apophysomyces sp. BC1021]KAG0186045.1 hypothetical protein DFQ28_008377 [Apophysomyces sp. BC1034]
MDNQNNDNASYLAMLNNPTINPPAKPPKKDSPKQGVQLASATFSAAMVAQQSLKDMSSDLDLVSETDAPFESLNIAWDKTALPTAEELINLGLVEEDGDREVKTVAAFFEPFTTEENDPYKQAAGFRALLQKFEELFSDAEQDAKVYLIGDITITVLILGIIRGDNGKHALVGLKSMLVET